MNEVTQNFNKIALLPDKWDHNKHYEKLIISEVPNGASILDIGCGTGELAKALSTNAKLIDAIDLSPTMIEQAKKRHSAKNINYIVKDFCEFDEENKYDCIVSVATFHHLDLTTALPKVIRLLKDGGVFIVLDLYERRGVLDRFLDLVAVPSNIILRLIYNKSLAVDPQEKALWQEHSKYDEYDYFNELKESYSKLLSNKISLRRLVFWRYLMVYKK